MKLLFLAPAAALALAGSAFAQDAAPPAAPAPAAKTEAPAAGAAVTDEEVQKVATLAAEVKKLNADAQPKLSAAADASAKAAVQKDLDTGIQAALTKSGLSADRYNEIARAAQADKALAGRIAAASSGGAAAQGTQSPTSATAPQ